jgi:hypothetical protein
VSFKIHLYFGFLKQADAGTAIEDPCHSHRFKNQLGAHSRRKNLRSETAPVRPNDLQDEWIANLVHLMDGDHLLGFTVRKSQSEHFIRGVKIESVDVRLIFAILNCLRGRL